VKVIGYHARSTYGPLVTPDDAFDALKEGLPVEVVEKDRSVVDPVRGDVMEAARIVGAPCAGHLGTVPDSSLPR
jgi:hypothetical protein